MCFVHTVRYFVSTVRNSDICLENEQAKIVTIPHLGFVVRWWENFTSVRINRTKKFELLEHSRRTVRISCRKSQKMLSNYTQRRPLMMRDGYCEESDFRLAVNVSRGEDGIYFAKQRYKEEVRCLVVTYSP